MSSIVLHITGILFIRNTLLCPSAFRYDVNKEKDTCHRACGDPGALFFTSIIPACLYI